MTKLNQVIAVEKGIKNRVTTEVTELYQATSHPALFEGFNKKYKPNEEGSETFPNEAKKVQKSSGEVLKRASSVLRNYSMLLPPRTSLIAARLQMWSLMTRCCYPAFLQLTCCF
jgi:hypothetical protein